MISAPTKKSIIMEAGFIATFHLFWYENHSACCLRIRCFSFFRYKAQISDLPFGPATEIGTSRMILGDTCNMTHQQPTGFPGELWNTFFPWPYHPSTSATQGTARRCMLWGWSTKLSVATNWRLAEMIIHERKHMKPMEVCLILVLSLLLAEILHQLGIKPP